jgi:F420H(2)-dependent quinone reductase
MAVVNVPMRVLLSLPFPTPLSGRLMLISYHGRRTGKLYRQPVSYVRQDHVLLTPGGGNWKWNLQDGQPVRLRLRGRDMLARPELIQDVDEIERLFAAMAAANPSITAFVPIPKGPDGHLDRGRLEVAVRYGFRIVRWRLGKAPM